MLKSVIHSTSLSLHVTSLHVSIWWSQFSVFFLRRVEIRSLHFRDFTEVPKISTPPHTDLKIFLVKWLSNYVRHWVHSVKLHYVVSTTSQLSYLYRLDHSRCVFDTRQWKLRSLALYRLILEFLSISCCRKEAQTTSTICDVILKTCRIWRCITTLHKTITDITSRETTWHPDRFIWYRVKPMADLSETSVSSRRECTFQVIALISLWGSPRLS